MPSVAERKIVVDYADKGDLEGIEVVDGARELLEEGDVTEADIAWSR
jgi:hypothetical protein